MRAWLEGRWYRAGSPPALLRAAEPIYAFLAARDRARKRAHATRLPVPVIVVGNLSVGGTGKTPVTLWLVGELQSMGRRPGILSRGYGGSGPFPMRVEATTAPARCGDEPRLMAQRAGVPVAVAPDRVAAGRLLLHEAPDVDVLVCDDGLQHLQLARDFELCVIDGARGFGNGHLLPAGPLREPPDRAAQVGALLVNGASRTKLPADALRFDLTMDGARRLRDAERSPLAAFAGREIHAVAGIGRPARFFEQLRDAGLRVIEHAFTDHHAYRPTDFRGLEGACVLMTEKDAVKCAVFAGDDWWSVPVQAQFASADAALLRGKLEAMLLEHARCATGA